jgi:DNA polymerase sigma
MCGNAPRIPEVLFFFTIYLLFLESVNVKIINFNELRGFSFTYLYVVSAVSDFIVETP